MGSTFQIQNKVVGIGQQCLVIAEAGVNHNGNRDLAHQLVDAAANAGADIVKFQTFKADEVVTLNAPKAQYQLKTTSQQESQLEMLAKLELAPEVFAELQLHAKDRGLIFLSTPFDFASVDLLNALNVPAFKVPSGEITNTPLLAYVAAKGKPLLISTGMSNLSEVEDAINVVRSAGASEIALFQCTSNYPTSPKDVNLRAMQTLTAKFGVPVGLSDHTHGWEISVAAVAMGAVLIEKHLTLNNKMQGPDHSASMEPHEFASMIKAIRNVELAMGSGTKEPTASEVDVASVARKSLVAVSDLEKGTVLRAEHICVRRPGTGLSPAVQPSVVGKTLIQAVAKGHLFSITDWES